MAALSKASFCCHSLARIAGFQSCLSLVTVGCFQVEFSATGRCLVQSRRTECGMSESDRRTSYRRPKHTSAFEPQKNNYTYYVVSTQNSFGNVILYEGWNFNFGNDAVTFETAHLQSSYFHRPSMYSTKLCRPRSQR